MENREGLVYKLIWAWHNWEQKGKFHVLSIKCMFSACYVCQSPPTSYIHMVCMLCGIFALLLFWAPLHGSMHNQTLDHLYSILQARKDWGNRGRYVIPSDKTFLLKCTVRSFPAAALLPIPLLPCHTPMNTSCSFSVEAWNAVTWDVSSGHVVRSFHNVTHNYQ